MPSTDSFAASIPQRWNGMVCMMVRGAKWWSRERGRTSVGQTFLNKPDSTDGITQTPGKIVVPNKGL
jgi:hypothetical protein